MLCCLLCVGNLKASACGRGGGSILFRISLQNMSGIYYMFARDLFCLWNKTGVLT